MTFHEIRIPEKWSFGSDGGPGYKTDILTMDSGAEERVSRWNQMRHRYTIEVNKEDFEDLRELREFFICRRGAAAGFRFRDLHDYATTTSGKTVSKFPYLTEEVVDHLDQLIGVGDGVTTVFQLTKTYTDGLVERKRNLEKPVAGTTRVAIDDVEQLTDWTVDVTTGEVTFTTAPGDGLEVTAGCEFDVPVRLGKEIDEVFAVHFTGPEHGGVVSVPIVELVSEAPVADEFFFGGSSSTAFDTDFSINPSNGVFQILQPQIGGLRAILPDTANRPLGVRHFDLMNDSIHAIDIANKALVTVATLGAGEFGTVDLGLVGSTKTWFIK